MTLTASAASALEVLNEVMWRERRVTEAVRFKLVEAKLILMADEPRFVPQALAELEAVVRRLRTVEHERDAALREFAAEVQMDVDRITLRALSEEAPEPWSTIFDDHRQAFLEMTAEIEDITKVNRRLATLAFSGAKETIRALFTPEDAGLYGRPGEVSASPNAAPIRVDEVL